MKKRKRATPLTIAEVAAQKTKRRRRTKKEMEAARALAFSLKRETVEAVYPATGYPLTLCPVCGSPAGGYTKKRAMPDLEVRHGGKTYSIRRAVYPCAREDCKTDIICFISPTFNQRDILFFLDKKRLSGDEHKGNFSKVTHQNTRSIGQPTTVSRGAIEQAPVEAKKKVVKRKR